MAHDTGRDDNGQAVRATSNYVSGNKLMFFEPTIEDIEACAERLDLDISSSDADRKIALEYVNYSNQSYRTTDEELDDLIDVVGSLLYQMREKTKK
ncbi:hypothetical protein ICL29_004086 [Salmonella enterica]|nr:hypothetical protein [Salmonella enterica]EHK5999362.1 hypothetical protein [Salmonella enterica]EIF5124581.1 hypothetical protein [Salmonella enterica]EIF5348757.1 hypothetical protein [Salmonella enterica]EIF5657354.1 hypothetical protein [Salmonella enterica]